jgi:beta-lactam-binding protein with PASTA domain/serine/threonine protein kinase
MRQRRARLGPAGRTSPYNESVPGTLIDPLVGRVVDGRYVVRELIARGGMASVYRATDKRLGRDIALKIMSTEILGQSADFSSRFRREARSAARLTHPGMVRVYDQGTDGDLNYLTMELIEGPNLRQRLVAEGTLPLGESMRIAEKLLDTIGAAHRLGLVHRDVKPENVLMDSEGEPKLADFGLARAVTEVTSATTGTILGTVAYLGPELVSKGLSDARTDVYAMGILLYEMVTGRQPFTGPSAIEVASRHVHEDVPPPSSYVLWLPPEFDALIARMADRDPRRRPSDANEALALVRQTRSMIDEPTLDRRAEPPSGSQALLGGSQPTAVLEPVPTGQTVTLPIGLGEDFSDEDDDWDGEVGPPTDDVPAKPRLAWWVGALAAAVVMLAAMGVWWYTGFGPGAYTSVPSVDGQAAAAAQATLEGAGLQVTMLDKFDDNVPVGVVIATDPVAESRIAKGGAVTVQVSKGPQMVPIPKVVGVTITDAKARIAAALFPDPTVKEEPSDTVPKDEVISCSPNQETSVRHDTQITLTVSTGPAPITIPNVVGSTLQTAQQVLGNDALNVIVQHGRTLDVAAGMIYKQDPVAGAAGFRTQDMTIWVSDGKPFVVIPDFTLKPVDEQVQRAEDLGLKVVLKKLWLFSTKNQIVNQDIAPGTANVEWGATITLTYN